MHPRIPRVLQHHHRTSLGLGLGFDDSLGLGDRLGLGLRSCVCDGRGVSLLRGVAFGRGGGLVASTGRRGQHDSNDAAHDNAGPTKARMSSLEHRGSPSRASHAYADVNYKHGHLMVGVQASPSRRDAAGYNGSGQLDAPAGSITPHTRRRGMAVIQRLNVMRPGPLEVDRARAGGTDETPATATADRVGGADQGDQHIAVVGRLKLPPNAGIIDSRIEGFPVRTEWIGPDLSDSLNWTKAGRGHSGGADARSEHLGGLNTIPCDRLRLA